MRDQTYGLNWMAQDNKSDSSFAAINRAITFRDLIEPVRMRHPHDRYYYTLSLNWTATSPTIQTDCFPMIAWTIRKGDSTLLIYMMSL